MPEGYVDARFVGLAREFERQLGASQGGAALCVYYRGRPVVDLWGGARNAAGEPWERDTLALSFSTTKGVTATALHRLVDRGLADYDDPVVRYWPEFGQCGKSRITIRQVLSHQAGLMHVRRMVDDAEQLLDWSYMVHALERSEPSFRPGSASGYHAFTFGWLVGELVERIAGLPFREVVRKEVCEPLELDGACVGADLQEKRRAAELLRPRWSALDLESMSGLASLSGRVTRRVRLPLDPSAMTDALLPRECRELFWHPRLYDGPMPAVNGLFTARSLAKLYASWAGGGELAGIRMLSRRTVRRATRVHVRTPDRVLMFRPDWRLGFHGAFTSQGRPPRGFGHFGFGGSGAWADPERKLAVAFVNNRLGGGPLGDLRLYRLGGSALKVVDQLRGAA